MSSTSLSSPGPVGSPAQLSRFAMSTPPHRRTQPAAAVSCPDSPPHTSARLAPALHRPLSCPDWPSRTSAQPRTKTAISSTAQLSRFVISHLLTTREIPCSAAAQLSRFAMSTPPRRTQSSFTCGSVVPVGHVQHLPCARKPTRHLPFSCPGSSPRTPPRHPSPANHPHRRQLSRLAIANTSSPGRTCTSSAAQLSRFVICAPPLDLLSPPRSLASVVPVGHRAHLPYSAKRTPIGILSCPGWPPRTPPRASNDRTHTNGWISRPGWPFTNSPRLAGRGLNDGISCPGCAWQASFRASRACLCIFPERVRCD